MSKKIKDSLIGQLEAHGAAIEAFKGLIDDYMSLYAVAKKLKADIKERGTIITEISSAGKDVTKCNPSIKELRDINKSMLAILKQLNLSVDTVRVRSDDDEL